MTTAERLTAVAENVQKVYEAGVRDGFTPPESEYLSPEYVYKTTRPAYWLPMPTPGDDECYCLGHILPGLSGFFYAKIRFSGSCSVSFGILENGVFVAKETYQPTSGADFSVTLNYADWGDELPDGTRQYIARIKGNITEIHFNRPLAEKRQSIIVDIACGLALTRFEIGSYNSAWAGVHTLKYLRFVGSGQPGFISATFVGGCDELLSVSMPNEIPYSVAYGYMNYTFTRCKRLMAVSGDAFGQMTNSAAYAFSDSGISTLKTKATPANMSNVFARSCLSFFDKDTMGTASATAMDGAFIDCQSLISVTDLDISSLTGPGSMFTRCYRLSRLVFAGETTPGGWTISLADTALTHEALVEMIASLPVATAAATITITGNPGATELTDAEIAVATAKNWTITI